MSRVKEAGIRNLVIGVILLFILSTGARYFLGSYLVYDEPALFECMYKETAERLRMAVLVPGIFFPLIFYAWMYFNYVRAINFIVPHIAAHEKRHAVIPGIALIAAEMILLFIQCLIEPNGFVPEELACKNMILGAFVKAGIFSCAVDLVLYILSWLFLKPDVLVGK